MAMKTEDAQKEYEDRLQRRLPILFDQLRAGKMHLNDDLRVNESLDAVRQLPDGSFDLATVDGLVRSLALMAEVVHGREEQKNAFPLSEIQTSYFEFLDRNFGSFFRRMRERGLTPHDVARGLSEGERSRAELLAPLNDFLKTIDEFWSSAGPAAHAHVEDMSASAKGIFGGDLFPSHSENIASKCGIYLDTLVLPDPFLRSKVMFSRWSDERKAYYFVKHALNLLQYRELACTNLSPPIVVVLPDLAELKADEKNFFLELGMIDAASHANKIFGQSFSTFNEVVEFASGLDSIEKAVEAVKDPSRVLFDTDWTGTLSDQLKRAMEREEYRVLPQMNPGLVLAGQAIGRMSVSNELLIKARRLNGTPLIDAPTSWQYFVWKLGYDAGSAEQTFQLPDLHVSRALHSLAGSEMQWLGKIPVDSLIEVRRSGAIHEIRDVLGTKIKELVFASPENFHRTTDQVFENINAAFDEHRAAVAKLRDKKWRFAGSDIGSWLVVGTLAVTAAATGTPVWGLAALAADQVFDGPKLRDIPGSIKKLAEETKNLKKSPVGILFRIAEKS
jgi:hypothetical protein